MSEHTTHFAIVKRTKRNDFSELVERCKQAIQIERFQFLKKSYTGCIFFIINILFKSLMKRLALKPLLVEFSGLVDAFLFARGSSSREADDSVKCKETGAEVGTSKERPFAVSSLLKRETQNQNMQ